VQQRRGRLVDAQHPQHGSVVVGAVGRAGARIEHLLSDRERRCEQLDPSARVVRDDNVLEVIPRVPTPTDRTDQDTDRSPQRQVTGPIPILG
jgi:hypothetical protein